MAATPIFVLEQPVTPVILNLEHLGPQDLPRGAAGREWGPHRYMKTGK